jgi:flagellar hook-length control protein FliK
VAAPPTAAARQFVTTGAPQTDLAGLGGIDFADVLTQLMAPSAAGPAVDLAGLLKKALVRPSTAVATPAVVLDGAVAVAVADEVAEIEGVDPGQPGDAAKLPALTEQASTGESPDALAAALAMAGILMLAAGSTVQPHAPAAALAPDVSASTGTPSTGTSSTSTPSTSTSSTSPSSTMDTTDRRTTDLAPTSAAGVAGRPETPPPASAAAAADVPHAAAGDQKTPAPVDHIEIEAAAVLHASAAAGNPAAVAPVATRSHVAGPAASSVAAAGLRRTAESAVQTAVDPSSADVSLTAIDRELSKGDARSGGGHGQAPHDAPTLAAAPSIPVPVPAAPPAVNGAPAAAIGEGLSSPLRTADAAELSPQIVQAIKLQWQGGVGEARIRLQPDYLGELTIAIRVERGGVTASLESDTPAVRQWLQGHELSLRQGLSDQGLQLDRLLVSEQSPRADWENSEKHQQDEAQSPGQKHPSRRRRPDEQTFEVVV